MIQFSGRGDGAVFAANDSYEAVPFSLAIEGVRVASCRITDETHTDVEVPVPSELPPHAFVLLSCADGRSEERRGQVRGVLRGRPHCPIELFYFAQSGMLRMKRYGTIQVSESANEIRLPMNTRNTYMCAYMSKQTKSGTRRAIKTVARKARCE